MMQEYEIHHLPVKKGDRLVRRRRSLSPIGQKHGLEAPVTLFNCEIEGNAAEVGIRTVQRQDFQPHGSGVSGNECPTEGTALPGESKCGLGQHFLSFHEACQDLDLVRIPEPAGLGGTASGHADRGPHLQRSSTDDPGLCSGLDQGHRESVDLKKDPFA